MRAVLLLVALFCAVYGLKQDAQYNQFMEFQQTYNKTYATETEFNLRFNIFKQNLVKAALLQSREQGTAIYGVTKFSDLTDEEFRKFYLMPKSFHANPSSRYHMAPVVDFIPNVTIPQDGMDWRQKGAITPVKNQGQCGSCWAFSATETVESYYHLCGHSLDTLSPQQIVDCDKTSYGCDGGWTEHAYNYLIKCHGQESAALYPYRGVDGTCKFNANDVKAKITGWNYVTKDKDESAMQQWVTSKGPLSICVDASTWSSYRSGVVKTCGKQIDHCVQLTGYSTISGVPAWHVRNSWGTDWGNSGYIYVERGHDVCAIAEDVTIVTC